MPPTRGNALLPARIAVATDDAICAVDGLNRWLMRTPVREMSAAGDYMRAIEHATGLVNDCTTHAKAETRRTVLEAAFRTTPRLDIAEYEVLNLERHVEHKLGQGFVLYRLRDLGAALGNLRLAVRARALDAGQVRSAFPPN